MPQTHTRSDQELPPTTPQWVKVFGVIAIILVLLVIILHLTGNSLGGPGSHAMPLQHSMPQP